MPFDDNTLKRLQVRVPDLPSPLRENIADLLEETIRIQAENLKMKRLVADVVTVLKSRRNPECNDPGTINTAETILAMIGRGY